MKNRRLLSFLLTFLISFSVLGNGTAFADQQEWQGAFAAGGRHTVFLNTDGTVSVIGDNEKGQRDTTGWSNVVNIAAGIYTTFGIREDGTVYAAGWNKHGQCDTSGWTDVVAVSASNYHTLGLKKDGTVYAAGFNAHGECNVGGWRNIRQIATGEYFSVGLKTDGTIVTTGDNHWGQRDVEDWAVKSVDAGYWHTVGLLDNGKVIATGRNNKKQCDVSGWSDVVQISAGLAHTVALCADGTVVATGDNSAGQCNVSNWHDICYVSAGMYHTLGLMEDGTIVAAGSNEWGQSDVSDIVFNKTEEPSYGVPKSSDKLNVIHSYSEFLSAHPEYEYGAYISLDGSRDQLILMDRYNIELLDHLQALVCTLSEDESHVNTYWISSTYHPIRFDPYSHALIADTGGTDAYSFIVFTLEDDRAYYWDIGYELAWRQEDGKWEEYYRYTISRYEAIPNVDIMESMRQLQSVEYITKEKFNEYYEYYHTLPYLKFSEVLQEPPSAPIVPGQ